MADHYLWRSGREAVLRLGPPGAAGAPLVLIAPALFEEANRTRAFTVAIMRGLADRGIASALPDLPGTNDSLLPTQEARLPDWRAAFAACAAEQPAFGFAVRGGTLVDGDATLRGRCHLAPVAGASLVRDMVRARRARGGDEPFAAEAVDSPGPPVELAGNHLARELIAALKQAEPSPADRILRLDSDSRAADRTLPGRSLWRSSEPDNDPALAQAIADDLAQWVRTCGG